MADQSFRISGELLDKLRTIAEREGMVLKILVERLIEAGIKAKRMK
jgi:predicted DNA-binding protein